MSLNSQLNPLSALYGGNMNNLNATLANLYNTQAQTQPLQQQKQQSTARNIAAANNDMKYMELLTQNLLSQSYKLDANKVTITPSSASLIPGNATTGSKSKSNLMPNQPEKNKSRNKDNVNKTNKPRMYN